MRFIVCCLCLSFSLSARQLDVQVPARAAILMNAETGAILYEKQAQTPIFPGSITKIATTLYILEKQIDLRLPVTISAEALRKRAANDYSHPYWLDVDGAVLLPLKKGEVVSLETLVYGMMLPSACDASNAAAEAVSGSVPQFMGEVNQYLRSIGCKNTLYCNPHGLHHETHISTVYDLALIMKRGLEIPQFRKIISTLSYPKPKSNKQPEAEIKLFNYLLKPKSIHYYPKAIGGKTGHHKATKYNLVAAAEHEGRTLIAVLIGCEDSGTRFNQAKRLFEAAFAEEKQTRRLMGPEQVFSKEVIGSQAPLKATVVKPLSINYFPSEEPKCKAALHWSADALPIRKGQKVGEICICDENDRLLQKGDLIALQEVKGTFWFTLKQKCLNLFR